LIISDPDWIIYDQATQEVPEPIELTIDSAMSIDKSNPQNSFRARIEYLTFETIFEDNIENNMNLHEFDFTENYWITPSVCDSLSNEYATFKVPQRFEMEIDDINELEIETAPNRNNEWRNGKDKKRNKKKGEKKEPEIFEEILVGRKRILVDQLTGYKRFEENGTILTKIYDSQHKILFELGENLFCKSYYNEKPPQDVNQELLDALMDIKANIKDYKLVGNEMVRNILTRVYKKKIQTHNDKNLKVISLKLQKAQSEKESFTHEPVQIRIESFKRLDQEYKKTSSFLFNFYDFINVKNDDELVQALDLTDCVDQSMVSEFTLIASREGVKIQPIPKEESDKKEEGDNKEDGDNKFVVWANDDKNDDKNDDENNDENNDQEEEVTIEQERFRKDFREILIKFVENATLINFPKIDITIHSKEIIADIKFVDPVSPNSYFSKPEKDLPLFDKEEEEKNKKIEGLKNSKECAISSLKDSTSTGYQYCRGKEIDGHIYCGLLDARMKLVHNNTKHCAVELKHNDLVNGEYLSLADKVNLLKTAIKDKGMNVPQDNKDYLFHRIHLVKEESLIDRSQLYSSIMKNHTLSEKTTLKSLTIDDGIINTAACYSECTKLTNDFACDSFAFCRRFDGLYDCYLGDIERDEKTEKLNDDEKFKEDKECEVFLISSLNHFQEHPGKKLKAKNDDKSILFKFDATKSFECAQYCLDQNREGKENCLSIETCEDEKDEKTSCRLSSENTLFETKELIEDNQNCYVYSAKHSLNFYPTTFTLLEDFVSKKVDNIDQCATRCDIDSDCSMFNYCETETGKSCRLKIKGEQEKQNTDLESDQLGCVTYIHHSQLLGIPKIDKKVNYNPVQSGNGYRTGSLFGYMFLFLFIGLIVGGAAFYAHKFHLNQENQGARLRDDDDAL